MKIEEIEAMLDAASEGPLTVSLPAYDMAAATILDRHGGILGQTTHHAKMRGDAALWAKAPEIIRFLLNELKKGNK